MSDFVGEKSEERRGKKVLTHNKVFHVKGKRKAWKGAESGPQSIIHPT